MKTDRVKVAGHTMAYLSEGEGEPVLLVHGITTYSFIWRRVIPLLSHKYRVIAPDLLGCGASEKPLELSYAIKDHAEYLSGFLEALNIPKVHFVGHDLGGGMGQLFAVRHPSQLWDLTLINSVAYDFWPVQPIIAMRTPVIRQFLMGCLDWGALEWVVKRGLGRKERLTPELMELFQAPLATEEGRKAFLHFARCLDNHNLMEIEEDLRRLSLPVLILRGDSDPYLSASISERLHQEIPGSRLVRFPHGGHFMQEDEPEGLAAAMLEFFLTPHE